MKKKFLRKSLNICISCSGRGTHTVNRVDYRSSRSGFKKNKYKYITQLCTSCYGTGIVDPTHSERHQNKHNVAHI